MSRIQFINLGLTTASKKTNAEPAILSKGRDTGVNSSHTVQIFTNVYNSRNNLTDYNTLITIPTINDGKTLFIYNANEGNSGYKGGIGHASATIGGMENTYGFFTGFLDKPLDNETDTKQGFPSLTKFSRFHDYPNGVTLKLNSGKMISGTTPRTLLDSLFTDLIETIKNKGYTRIILLLDKTGNLGSQVFEIGDDVKAHIINNFAKLQPKSNWRLLSTITENIKQSKADNAKRTALEQELASQRQDYAMYISSIYQSRKAWEAVTTSNQSQRQSRPAKEYPLQKYNPSIPKYGWDFDGVLHASVTPLICSSGNCSRHPVNKKKKVELKVTKLDDVIHALSNLNLINANHYIISSNPHIVENIKPLCQGMNKNPFVGVIHAGHNKLDKLRELNLDAFYDDSNMHLYNILDAKDKTGLPKNIFKVIPEALYNIYDATSYKTHPPSVRPAGTNNPYLIQIENPATYIRVFTYNIYYKITTNPETHQDHIKSIGAIINHVTTDPAHNVDFICLQESTMSGTALGADMSGYTELANSTGFPADKAIESQFTYYDNAKYTQDAVLFGNLDGPEQTGSRFPGRPFTLVCLYYQIQQNKIILINVHFQHTTRSNAESVDDIKHFIETADPATKDKILEYINDPATRIIMAGDFNRIIKGNPGSISSYDNSHYGLALFHGLYRDNKEPVILYNIAPEAGHFENKANMTCCDTGGYNIKSSSYYNHADNVLDSWGLQYKYEYPNTDYNIPGLTNYASDHRPVMVTLLGGSVTQINKANIRK